MPESLLHDAQLACGAVYAPEVDEPRNGSPRLPAPPLHFGHPVAEYNAATSSIALFDLSNRVQIEIAGDDRVKFLHNFCTNDIKGLKPGSGCEAFVTNVKGRILGHMFVFAGADSLWLESVPGSEETLLAHLDRYILSEDVQLQPCTAEMAELYICGPSAPERLSAWFAPAGTLPLMGHATGMLSGVPVAVRRVDFTLAPGFLLSVARAESAALWQSLKDAEIPPVGSQVFEALRIEAGMPWYGIDLSDENLAQEAGRTSRAISFKKGCYLGQEPIARIDAMGHVNRELRALRLDALPVPPVGSIVVSPGDQKEIGVITSAALSYSDNRPVALACLRSQFSKPGTRVNVVHSDGNTSAAATVFWPPNL